MDALKAGGNMVGQPQANYISMLGAGRGSCRS